jgi:hypothetical protein
LSLRLVLASGSLSLRLVGAGCLLRLIYCRLSLRLIGAGCLLRLIYCRLSLRLIFAGGLPALTGRSLPAAGAICRGTRSACTSRGERSASRSSAA